MRMAEGKNKTLKISTFDKLHVNAECLQEKKTCLKLIEKFRAVRFEKEQSGQLGNPASHFCQNAGGEILILEDKKHNEYDYCKISEKYMVDSWDLYRRFKK